MTPLAFALGTFSSLTGGKLKIALENVLLLNRIFEILPRENLNRVGVKGLFVCLFLFLSMKIILSRTGFPFLVQGDIVSAGLDFWEIF